MGNCIRHTLPLSLSPNLPIRRVDSKVSTKRNISSKSKLDSTVKRDIKSNETEKNAIQLYFFPVRVHTLRVPSLQEFRVLFSHGPHRTHSNWGAIPFPYIHFVCFIVVVYVFFRTGRCCISRISTGEINQWRKSNFSNAHILT